ncbi:ABC transporter permease subunit [Salinarimonas rosea]|uniref:ABC transporter permease subunit n=1 Tax=Salinarimonas rosea TaxID=552063 RepID=UPI00040CFF05|nr:ABC transporter permease subunit [Salinarimonas rosea]
MARDAIRRDEPRRRGLGRRLVIGAPYLWLGAFFALPVLIVFKIALSYPELAQPPYAPTFDLAGGWEAFVAFLGELSFDNFAFIVSDDLYVAALGSSLRIAASSTLILLLVGYPIAYAMAKASPSLRGILVAAVILPFWTSFLIRVYAWIGILRPEGLLNGFLMAIGVIDQPLTILNTEIAVHIGIVYTYLPFMVLPLYATLERMDDTLIEAAQDLGSTPLKAFWTITVPLSWPGIVAGSLLCFIPAVGEFVIPDLLGGSDTLMIGRILWSEFFSNRDWPLASAVAIVMLVVLVVPIVLFREAEARRLEESR